MKGIRISAVVIAVAVIAIGLEIWLLRGPSPRIALSLDSRFRVVCATFGIGLSSLAVLIIQLFDRAGGEKLKTIIAIIAMVVAFVAAIYFAAIFTDRDAPATAAGFAGALAVLLVLIDQERRTTK